MAKFIGYHFICPRCGRPADFISVEPVIEELHSDGVLSGDGQFRRLHVTKDVIISVQCHGRVYSYSKASRIFHVENQRKNDG